MPSETFFNLPEEKRERIISLAIEEFSTSSFHLASLSRIVARAGIAKGSIYQYFDNKLDLYRWLLLDELPQRKREWLARFPPPEGADLFGMLEHSILTGIRFGLTFPRLNRLAEVLFEPTSNPDLQEMQRDAQRMTHEVMRQLIDQVADQGLLREALDRDVAADFLSAVLQGGMSRILLSRTGLELYTLLSQPEVSRDFGEEEQKRLAAEIMDLVRFGLSGKMT